MDRESSSLPSPAWATDDPNALSRWLESSAAKELGREVNRWIGVIESAAFMIWNSPDPLVRRKFRDAALLALEKGRQNEALPDAVYVERMIYVRMSYLRNSDEGQGWLQQEMSEVFDFFVAAVRVNAASAKETLDRGSLSLNEMKNLRRVRSLLNLMRPGLQYLTGSRHAAFDDWLEISPQLP
jgi:hypothetical protein